MEFQCFCCHVCHVLVCSLAGLRTSFAFSPVRSKLQGINITEALQHPWLQYAVRQLRWSSVDLPSEHGWDLHVLVKARAGGNWLLPVSVSCILAILRRTHETIWNRRLAAASTMSSLGHYVYLLYLPRRGYKRRTRPFRVTLHRLCVTACIAQKRVAGSSSGCWIVAWLHPLCLSLFSLIHWIFAVGYEISKRCCERWLLRPLFLASIGLSFLEVFFRMPCIDSVVSSFPVPLCMFEGSRSQACSGPLVQPKDHSQSEASYRQLNHVEPLGLNDVLSSTQCCNPLPLILNPAPLK